MTEIQDNLIKLGANYLNISEEEFRKRMTTCGKKSVENWKEMGIERFYNETDTYIYDLIDFNDTFRIDSIIHPLKFAKNLKILDYGGGIGVLSNLLAKINTTYYYDLKGKTRDFAIYLNSKSQYKTTFVQEEEIDDLDIDTIVCVDVLEHVKEPMKLVKKFTDKLSSKGLFLTTGLDFSVGPHIPMHLQENIKYKEEYDIFMYDNYRLLYFNHTKNEMIYLWVKK